MDLYQAWGIGKKGIKEGSDRGVLILIRGEGPQAIHLHGLWTGEHPARRNGRPIGRQMVPMLRNNDFDGAVTLAVNQISQIIARDAGVTLTPLTRRRGTAAGSHQPGQADHLWHRADLLLAILARFGGSGLIGFLLGMFMGGGFGGGGDEAAVEGAMTAAAALAALAAEVPAAVAPAAIGKITVAR